MNARLHEGRTELRKAAIRRLQDAERLFADGAIHAHCAAYIAGYAIECKLKAIAMEVFNVWTLSQLAVCWGVEESEVFTHGLESLLNRLPLVTCFRQSDVWRDFVEHVNHWRPSWRYNPGALQAEQYRSFLEAVKRVYHWLDANRG